MTWGTHVQNGTVRRRRLPWVLAVLAAAGLALGAAGPTPATAAASHDLVGVVPSASTPSVLSSPSTPSAAVLAIATVGGKVVLGGTFTQVANAGGAPLPAHNLLIFDAETGLITKLPAVNGTVSA